MIPDLHHHVGGIDLFNGTPFPLDDDYIVQPNGLRQRNLNTGNQIFEKRPSSNADHNSRSARLGQKTSAELTNTGKSHQHRADPDQHDGEMQCWRNTRN